MGKGRERQIIGTTICPQCHAGRGHPCAIKQGRPMVHSARKDAWQAARPVDPLDADILLSYQATGLEGQRTTWMIFAPLSALGRAVMPETERRENQIDGPARLRELQARGLAVRREDE